MRRITVHGYYASVSYIDAQIGRLMDGLKENGAVLQKIQHQQKCILVATENWNMYKAYWSK